MARAADGGGDAGVDRRTVTRELRELVGPILAGQDFIGTSVFVDGPPGIGKSFLVEGILKELPDTVEVLRAAGDYRRRNDPFSSIEQLTGTAPAGMDPSDVAFDRVDGLCAVGPVVVWMDDAHNADAASLTVLRRLVWASRSLPLVVVISARPFPAREPVDMLVRQVQHQLRLPGMDQSAIDQMVADRTGRLPAQGLLDELKPAAGNPLFLVELLTALDRSGSLVRVGSSAIDVVPGAAVGVAGLETIIREHLGQLDESARDLLAALAIWGTPVTMSDLAAVLYSAPEDLQAPLERAVRAGIVRVGTAENVALIDFSHDLYREVLYQDLPLGFRQATHRRIATLLEATGVGQSLVAEHLLQAAAAGSTPSETSVLAAVQDAVAASRMYAPEVAADLLGQAETIAASVESETLLYQRIHELILAGKGAAADQLVRDRIGGVTDQRIAAGMQALLIRSLVYRAETAGAIAAIDRTVAIPGLPGSVLHQMQALRGWVLVLGGQPPSETEDEAMLARFVSAGDRSAQATLMVNQACSAHLAGNSAQALEIMRNRSRLVTDDQDWQSRSTSLVWPSLFELASHGPAAGLAAVQQARRLSTERSAHWIDAYLCSIAGGAAMISGEWDDAVAELDTALELAEETGTGWISISVGNRSYLDAHRGRAAAARARLEEFRYSGRPLQFGQNDPGHAELAILEAMGSVRAAGPLARSLWSSARVGSVRWAHFVAPDIARVALLGEDRWLAGQVSDDLGARPTPDGDEGVPALVHGMLHGDPDEIAMAATLFEADGRFALAAQAWEEHACAAAAMAAKPMRSATAHSQVPPKEVALDSLDKATSQYERMGAVPDRDRALARMRALGVRRGARVEHRTAASGWASLTATELRIAALMREGLTNREIGTRLFVSPRTVQTHVSHILAKTGLRSRVEVAAADAG